MTWQEIHQLDQSISLEINSWHSTFSDPIWSFFSDKYVWIPMYVAIVALLIWKLGWKQGLIVTAGALLTFGFCDQFSNLIKDAVARIRPVNDEFMIASGLHILERGGGYSFFSAHAANAFGLATCTATGLGMYMDNNADIKTPVWYKSYCGWMFFWAAMVSISRVFVGRHYLGDVLAGTIIGITAGYAFARLAKWVIRRFTVS